MPPIVLANRPRWVNAGMAGGKRLSEQYSALATVFPKMRERLSMTEWLAERKGFEPLIRL